jgi:NAD(P)-dependent dehydrogenase (short-subunit alcohol dehydrogenase family)
LYPSLAGRVALVTGGASGIGADIVRAYAANRAKVAFVDILEEDGNALSAETGAFFIKTDITDIPALQSAIRAVKERLGPIGILVNNAANDDRRPIDEIDEGYWDNSQAVNVRHHFFASQAVRPQMRELGGGSIINLSSIAWRGGADAMAAYATAKAGIVGLTRALARGFGADNIRVNAIEPGAVMTARQRALWYKDDASVEAVVGRQPIKRVLLGEHVARLALFLASDESSMITKQSIAIDAGLR